MHPRSRGVSGFVVRPMQPTDVPHLVRIDRDSNPSYWTKQMFERELGLPYSLSRVVVKGGAPVGFGVAWAAEENAHLLQVAVAHAFRRQGAGKAVLNSLMEACRKKGCKKITLEVRRKNAPALQFYGRRGFKTMGLRKNFYADDDAWVIACAL